MRKLLHISGNIYPSLNGDDHHTRRIWEELAIGFDEYHILARSENNQFSYTREKNIHLHLVPKIMKKSRIFFLSSFYMFFLIKKWGITHLLAQCSIVGGFSAAIASKFYKIPLMVEIHGEEYFSFLGGRAIFQRINSFLMLFVFRKAKKIRSLNKKMTKKLDQFGLSEKIVEIPNRVNFRIFNQPKSEYKLHIPLRLVSVGRFVKEKDYLRLINNLEEMGAEYHLTLIGGGVFKEKYSEFISKNKIEKKVTLIDWVDQKNLIKLIRDSDIYIQSSVSEGMPRAILEAMALKMPIISTRVGSISGVLTHLVNSVLIEENETSLLEQAISLLMKNEEVRRRIANKAYLDVVEKYEWYETFRLYRNEIINMERAV